MFMPRAIRSVRSIGALIRKEALMIVKDKRSRMVLLVPILVQTLLFGYVATYDLNRVDYALLDEDRSPESRELVRRFDGTGIFRRQATLRNAGDIPDVLDYKQALLVLHIGPGFSRDLNAGRTAPVQVLVDGRNSNVAGTASGYATGIVEGFSRDRLRERGVAANPVTIASRAWFNPNLETRWNIISGMLAVLSVIQVLVLAGQSVAREREQGTFDQLLVTPFGPMALMIGKALPPVLVGLAQASIVLCIALYWFAIPYAGSFVLLYAGLLLFNAAIVGIGLCVSTLTSTMQQAMLFTFTLLMPMILLSGFTTPVSSMPQALRAATLLNPVRHGVELAQRVYLEGAGLAEVQHLLLALAGIALASLGLASRLFRLRLS